MRTGTSMSLTTCSLAACRGVRLAALPVPMAGLLLPGAAGVCIPWSRLKLMPCACCALRRYQELLGALHNPAAAPALRARYPIQATAVQLSDFVHTASSSLPCLLLVSLELLLSLRQWVPCCWTAVQCMGLCWPCALVDAPGWLSAWCGADCPGRHCCGAVRARRHAAAGSPSSAAAAQPGGIARARGAAAAPTRSASRSGAAAAWRCSSGSGGRRV